MKFCLDQKVRVKYPSNNYYGYVDNILGVKESSDKEIHYIVGFRKIVPNRNFPESHLEPVLSKDIKKIKEKL